MTKVRGFDLPMQRNLGPNREGVRNHSDQLRNGLQTAGKKLATDEAKVGNTQAKVLELSARALSLNIQLSQAKGKPTALKQELAAVQGELQKALTENQAAVKSLGNSKKNLEAMQNLVLAHESSSDVALAQNGRAKEFDVSAVDVTDAASLTRKEQVRILGRPVEVSVDEATSSDRRQVSMSIAVKPENGAAMLALQLENSPPEVQSELLRKLSDPKQNRLDDLMKAAGSSKAVAAGLLDAAANASGPARKQLLSALAKHGGANAAAAAKELIKKGESFEVSAALIKELKAAGKTGAVTELTGAVAGKLKELRGQFEKTKKVTDELNGDLARLVVGFGKSLDKDQLAKGVEAFKQGHTKQYDAFENASKEYAKALTLLTAAGDMPVPDQAMTLRVKGSPGMSLKFSLGSEADNAIVGFHDELNALAKKNLQAVMDTPEGQEVLQKAFHQQSAGIPNWVDSLKDLHGVSKDLHGTLSKTLPTIVSQGLGRMALRGTATKEITDTLLRNHQLLGLTREGAESFANIARTLADKKLDPGLRNAALEQVKTGEWPPKVKLLGVALALPDLVGGISNFSNAKTVDQLSTIVKGADLTNEIAGLMMKETAFMNVLGKGLGVAGAVLDVAGGVGKILDGETVNGSADIASGVGAGLMLIPGGQLAGAAIIAASLIAKHVWGEDPAADAEKADEKDAKAFLEAAGLKTETAGALSNVRQSDRRNIGTFVDQAAAYLGMSPAALLKKLDALPKSKLEAFTRMVLEMPADKNWKYATKKKVDLYQTDNVRQARSLTASFGPKSMPTAIEWMKNNGVI